MKLGETIYQLRTQRNLSQNDLADLLDVSRQSVSKWETDTSVPDLDKLVKMSEIFGVTLDVLVHGADAPTQTTVPEASAPQSVIVQQGKPSYKTAGIILLCTGAVISLLFLLLQGSLVGGIFSIPFFVCSIICFASPKHTGLWCIWALFLMADLYLLFGTGIRWSLILVSPQLIQDLNPTRLLMAWIMLAVRIALVLGSAYALRRPAWSGSKQEKVIALCAAVLFVALHVPFHTQIRHYSTLIQVLFLLRDFCKLGLLTLLATLAARWLLVKHEAKLLKAGE